MDNKNQDLELCNKELRNGLIELLGIVFTEVRPGLVKAKMDVTKSCLQPYKILHGGISAVLAESVGSFGSNFLLDRKKEYSVGLELNVNHLKKVVEGEVVEAEASLIHQGKKTHVWDIKIKNEKGELTAISRLTTMVLPLPTTTA